MTIFGEDKIKKEEAWWWNENFSFLKEKYNDAKTSRQL